MSPRNSVLDGSRSPVGRGGTFEEGRDQLIVTYLCMNALCLTRANVPAHCQVHAAYEYISCRKE